ncbi:AbiV family abortive infection protein [Flagellimonas sp. CMM7]|uniref:AbiV family abortive infection protein n=1 Tax=Flagellimonas sp. CMM7 TaxID=2654676 RepID=UPI0013D133D1|nr:AbiV family abortive infection protein [Flagellimonas sp. CMM7]UII81514.1 AbiV family abortive infection protein [Flagellimonas sp. CMM7]
MRGKQYNSRLDPKTASEGIRLAIENADSLVKDAQLLFDNNRYERCVAIAILSIEEAGKSSIIRSMLLTDDKKELSNNWKRYRRHTEKNLAWIMPELYAKGARKIDDLKWLYNKESSHGQTLDNLKQLSFYTDIFSSKKWSSPSNVIDKELAEQILKSARILAKKHPIGINSEEGLKLWVKHLKPVYKKDLLEMKQALINCYCEAEELGIIEKGKTDEMTSFVL